MYRISTKNMDTEDKPTWKTYAMDLWKQKPYLCSGVAVSVVSVLGIIYEYQSNYFHYQAHYETNVYDTEIFAHIQSYCLSIPEEDMVADPKARGRLMYVLDEPDICALIYHPEVLQKIRDITDNPLLVPCEEIPIEYRRYPLGSGMHWHADKKMLSDQRQYECVIVVENSSDSVIVVEQRLYQYRIATEANSLFLVQAQGVKHMVTPVTRGTRSILKFALKEEENV